MKPGDTVSRYKILGQVGQGGMGVVYHAEDTRLHRPVALKFLPPESLSEMDRQRFLNEARSAAAISHPNICPVYDVDEVDGQVFIAMAYIEGQSLSKMLATGPLDLVTCARVGAQIASGLEAAHKLGIVHRDIKAGNVMIGDDGHVSILDFGLALRDGTTRLTAVGGTAGTPSYMSPEQTLGKPVDFRTDIWSLGVLLFEMVTGSLPFRRDHQAAVAYAIVHDAPPPVAGLRPATTPELRRAIERSLCKEPSERWSSAREIAEELRKAAGDSEPSSGSVADVTMTIAPGSALPAGSNNRKYPKPLLAITAIGVALLAGGMGLYRHFRPPATPQVSASAVNERQVAVLPFQVAAGDSGAVTVADGMVEILTGALSDYSLFRGKITAVPASEIRRRAINSAEEARRVYGVNLVVSGSARQAGPNVDFTLNLIDAVKLQQLDSKTVSYDPTHPAEAKTQVVDQLARMLNFELTPVERRAVTAGDSNAPGAYRAYLEGRGLLARYDLPGNKDRAIDAFQRAIAQDANYALAYAGLGEAYWRKWADTREKQLSDLAVKNAEQAVALDPNLAIGHAILGQVYDTAGRQQEAIVHLRRAIEIAPRNAEAPRQLAKILADTGRLAEAEQSYLRATEARPIDWYGYLLLGLFYSRQEKFEDAEKAFRKAEALTPDNELVTRNLAALYYLQGRYKDAEAEIQRTLKTKSIAPSFGTLAAILFAEHRYKEAVEAMETAVELDAGRALFWGNLGIYYRWAPGSGAKAEMAFQKAIDMSRSSLESAPNDYDTRANLAEYRARMGDAKGALEEVARIPKAARRARAARLVLAYELSGRRKEAIETVREYITTPAAMHQIKDDPDLARLWADAGFRQAIPARLR